MLPAIKNVYFYFKLWYGIPQTFYQVEYLTDEENYVIQIRLVQLRISLPFIPMREDTPAH